MYSVSHTNDKNVYDVQNVTMFRNHKIYKNVNICLNVYDFKEENEKTFFVWKNM